MPQHPDNVLQVSLRIRKDLHRKLKREAAKHRVSLNNEIVLRLNDSFEDLGARRTLSDITAQMSMVWSQLAAYLAASQRENELASAVVENKDPKEIVKLLQDWLGQRYLERRTFDSNAAFKAAGFVS
jgi:hypothetical protein